MTLGSWPSRGKERKGTKRELGGTRETKGEERSGLKRRTKRDNDLRLGSGVVKGGTEVEDQKKDP